MLAKFSSTMHNCLQWSLSVGVRMKFQCSKMVMLNCIYMGRLCPHTHVILSSSYKFQTSVLILQGFWQCVDFTPPPYPFVSFFKTWYFVFYLYDAFSVCWQFIVHLRAVLAVLMVTVCGCLWMNKMIMKISLMSLSSLVHSGAKIWNVWNLKTL